MQAITPILKLVRRNTKIYTVAFDNETLVAESPTVELARWTFHSLAMYHKASTEEFDAV